MDNILTSDAWKQVENEPQDIYLLRIGLQTKTWLDMTRNHGNCYMVKFGENDIRPMWEDQIDSEELVKMVPPLTRLPYTCPLCQPYDYFDTQLGQFLERRYLTRIVNPKYKGFIDTEGVFAKCPCRLKGEDRKWLKFKKMTINK